MKRKHASSSASFRPKAASTTIKSSLKSSAAKSRASATSTSKQSKTLRASSSHHDDTENADDLFFESDDERSTGSDAGKAADDEQQFDDDPYAHETPDEKRVRLAKDYLSKLEHDITHDYSDAPDSEHEEEQRGITRAELSRAVDERLQHDIVQQRHQQFNLLASHITQPTIQHTWKGHKKTVTSLSLTGDSTSLYSASKDCNVIHYDVATGQRYTYYSSRNSRYGGAGHRAAVLAVAVSEDGSLMASGDEANLIKIWDTRSHTMIKEFKAHRDAITGLTFRLGTHSLFSCSLDRTVKVFDLDQLVYVDTLFGHQAEISCIDALWKDRAITCGRDKTIRLWKIMEESQLMFRGHVLNPSIDCITMLNEETFFSGSQDGSVQLWNANKKKSVTTLDNAHDGAWVSSVTCRRLSDLLFSGSSNGFINCYQLESGQHRVSPLPYRIPVQGYVNAMCVSQSGSHLFAGVGVEHRLGRWSRAEGAQNQVTVIALNTVKQQAQVQQEKREEKNETLEREQVEVDDDDEGEEVDEGQSADDNDEPEPTPAPAPKRARPAAKTNGALKTKATANGRKKAPAPTKRAAGRQ